MKTLISKFKCFYCSLFPQTDNLLSSSHFKIIILLLIIFVTINVCNCGGKNINDSYFVHTYGGKGQDSASKMINSFDNGYFILGTTWSFGNDPYREPMIFNPEVYYGTSDGWLIKTDNNGKIIWQNTYGTETNDGFYDIEITNDNNLVLVGYESDSTSTNNAWILKLDNGGNIIWQEYIGGQVINSAVNIQQTNDGGYIFCGNINTYEKAWVVKLKEDGSIDWEKYYWLNMIVNNCKNIKQTLDNGYIIFCETGSYKKINYLVIRLDNNGNVLWSKIYDTSGYDYPIRLLSTLDGGYILGGTSTTLGQRDSGLWIIKIDLNGDIKWQKKYTNSNGEIYNFKDFIQDNSGNVVMLGGNGYDTWIVEIDSLGNIVWQKNYAVPVNPVSIDNSIDNGYIVSAGSNKIFAMKIDDIGETKNECFNKNISDTQGTYINTNVYPLDVTVNVDISKSMITKHGRDFMESDSFTYDYTCN